jgi:hypothetical protein
MAELFDIDLIPRIPSLDRKVRLAGIEKRRERNAERDREYRSKQGGSRDSAQDESEKQGTIDITV